MRHAVRLGFIGCGDISRFMAMLARVNPFIRIEACAAPGDGHASGFAKRHGIGRHFTDYREMIEAVPLDAVYVAVPHDLHHSIMLHAISSGLHVLCEKPVTRTLDEALEVCALARATGKKAGVNYQYRYDYGCHALARAARRGALGALYHARCGLAWHRDEKYFSDAPWRASVGAAGGGTLLTHASHILDIALWSFAARPVRVQATSARRRFTNVEVEDLAMGTIELADGSLIQVSSSMIATPEQPVTIDLYGSRGTALYSGTDYTSRLKFRGVRVTRERPPVRGLHPLSRSMDAFRRWITGGPEYLTPVEQSLPVLAVIEAMYRAAKTGEREEVDARYLEFTGGDAARP
jgi:UDP-N-acetyl-2-amino-2-deoxyglucuronate dehydrogenase